GIRAYRAPGRVNLIGEHTDYNGGPVFPAALTFGTSLLIRPRTDRRIGLASLNFPQAAGEFALDGLAVRREDGWMIYPKAVIRELDLRGIRLSRGYDLLYHGEIPNGAGLSSSASIEVVTAYALLVMEGHEPDPVRLAQWCQHA